MVLTWMKLFFSALMANFFLFGMVCMLHSLALRHRGIAGDFRSTASTSSFKAAEGRVAMGTTGFRLAAPTL